MGAAIVPELGRFIVWTLKLRQTNGPHFKWPMILFSSPLPEQFMGRMGKIYDGKPMKTKSRRELIASIRPNFRSACRPDCGDLPDGWTPPRKASRRRSSRCARSRSAAQKTGSGLVFGPKNETRPRFPCVLQSSPRSQNRYKTPEHPKEYPGENTVLLDQFDRKLSK